MHYKFIDIGCGHHAVSSDLFGTDVVGMYVEPVEGYLKVLPAGANIVKECAAISNYDGTVELNAVLYDNMRYYSASDITEIINNEAKLAECAATFARSGCSSIYDVTLNAGMTTKISVPCMTLQTLFDKHNVTEIDYLKIDVEGHEEVIIKELMALMHSGRIKINMELKYECTHNIPRLHHYADIICDRFGFTKRFVIADWDEDIILTKI